VNQILVVRGDGKEMKTHKSTLYCKVLPKVFFLTKHASAANFSHNQVLVKWWLVHELDKVLTLLRLESLSELLHTLAYIFVRTLHLTPFPSK